MLATCWSIAQLSRAYIFSPLSNSWSHEPNLLSAAVYFYDQLLVHQELEAQNWLLTSATMYSYIFLLFSKSVPALKEYSCAWENCPATLNKFVHWPGYFYKSNAFKLTSLILILLDYWTIWKMTFLGRIYRSWKNCRKLNWI